MNIADAIERIQSNQNAFQKFNWIFKDFTPTETSSLFHIDFFFEISKLNHPLENLQISNK